MSQNDSVPEEAHAPSAADPFDANLSKLLGARVGNYVIERPLAQGGMGSVFVAKHPSLGREVAIKFLSQQVSSHPHLAQRFLSEAQLTASLHHPNIVDIFDFGELDHRLYYVMELLRGRNLRSQMKTQGRFPLRQVQAYVEQICSALDAAHHAGIIHRDLKPGNVFVLQSDPPRIKLLDFGVAKVMSTSNAHTLDGQVIGTPGHMAPEQALGDVQRITPQSDLYSLGVIAYELLTGVPVFRHESEMMLMVMHVRDPIRPVREVAPDVHEGIAKIVEACLSKDPKDRPQSARILADEFARAARAAGVTPEPRSTRGQPQTSSSGLYMASVAAKPVSLTGSGMHRAVLGTEDTVTEASAGTPQAPNGSKERPPNRPLRPEVPFTAVRQPSGTLPAVQLPKPPLESTLESAEVEPAPKSRELASSPERQESLANEPPERLDTPMTANGQSTLNKLLTKLKRRGDFPAFAQNVGEVSKRADAESAYSAGQLGDTILKDYALTAKLLKVVNSMYAHRFGGKIYSVRHAIVILGFDRVRSLALSISLFKASGKKSQSPYVVDSAINSLVSGEIARSLATATQLNDEEAMVCAIFHNLGRHLVAVHLPELYEQVVRLVEEGNVSLRAASDRVLGISLGKLGVAVAQGWKLPPRLLASIAVVPAPTGSLTRTEDRLSALTEFSNELCEIISSDRIRNRERAITDLMLRHKNLLSLNHEGLTQLLARVHESFRDRYAQLGLNMKASRFMNNLPELFTADGSAPESSLGAMPEESGVDSMTVDQLAPEALVAAGAFAQAGPTPHGLAVQAHAGTKPLIAPLRLGLQLSSVDEVPMVLATPTPDPEIERNLEQRIEQIRTKLSKGFPADTILSLAVEVWAGYLGLNRLLILATNRTRDELFVRFGLREDIEAIGKELHFPLKNARAGSPFLSAYNSGKDVVIPDAFDATIAPTVPVRYYEVLGSPAFALYSCLIKGTPPALVMVDLENPAELPDPHRIANLAKLRPLIAQAASRF